MDDVPGIHPLAFAADLIEGRDGVAAPEVARREAEMLLGALGYDAAAGAESCGTANRAALLRLGARIGRVFRLPSPRAPGLFVMGAKADGATGSGHAGRGESLAAAFESCMGEAAEHLSVVRRDGDPLIAADGTVAGIALADGAHCRLPAGTVLVAPDDPAPGTGAGRTVAEATRAALLEAVERDAVARWWQDGAPARRIAPPDPDWPAAEAVLARLRAGGEGARQTWCLDLTPAHGIAVAAALSSEADGSAVVAGVAAGADLAGALRGALLELCQMEVASDLAWRRLAEAGEGGEAALAPQDRTWIARRRGLSTGAVPALLGSLGGATRAVSLDAADPVSDAARRLAAEGHPATAAEITRPEIGVPVVGVSVEGFRRVGGWASLSPPGYDAVSPI